MIRLTLWAFLAVLAGAYIFRNELVFIYWRYFF